MNMSEFYAEYLLETIETERFGDAKRLILELKADPNLLLKKRGIAPIHYVAGMPNFIFGQNLMKIILENGGDPNIRTVDNETPLHVAVFSNHYLMVQMLLDFGADVELRDDENKTPISYAIEEGFGKLVWLFRKRICMKKIEETQKMKINSISSSKTPTKLLSVPSASNIAKSPSQILTPNRTDFNYETASPYFVNISRRRRWNEPPTAANCISRRVSVEPSLTNDESTVHTVNENDLLSSDDECDLVQENLFQLTEKNLEKHLKNSLKLSRRSMVDEWRGKVNKTRNSQKNLIDLEAFLTECESTSTKKSTPFASESVWTVINVEQDRGHDTDATNCESFVTAAEDSIYTIKSPNARNTIVQSVEKYQLTDTESNITFYETKLLIEPTKPSDSIDLNDAYCETETASSDVTIPLESDYDTDVLREELTVYGAAPGPITKSTKRLYLRRLIKYQRKPETVPIEIEHKKCFQNYSLELQKFLRQEKASNWIEGVSGFLPFEKQMQESFKLSSNKCFREGNLKTSFNYLLLDPLIAENLPGEAQVISKHEVWQKFIASIFYVGKGKSSRPYEHLYEAIKLYQGSRSAVCETKKCYNSSKIERIIEIWNANKGVICLPVFHNILPIEAFSREAAMIDCLDVKNLTNLKRGDYYGITLSWPMRQRKQLGVVLLYKAMNIFLQEGESQLRPNDVRR